MQLIHAYNGIDNKLQSSLRNLYRDISYWLNINEVKIKNQSIKISKLVKYFENDNIMAYHYNNATSNNAALIV